MTIKVDDEIINFFWLRRVWVLCESYICGNLHEEFKDGVES